MFWQIVEPNSKSYSKYYAKNVPLRQQPPGGQGKLFSLKLRSSEDEEGLRGASFAKKEAIIGGKIK